MGKCAYCGENAGLFRNAHKECENRHSSARQHMILAASKAAKGEAERDQLIAQLASLQESSYVPASGIREALIRGLGSGG